GHIHVVSSAGPLTKDSNNGSADIFVAKLDSQGNILWFQYGGGPGDDDLAQIAGDGNDDPLLPRSFFSTTQTKTVFGRSQVSAVPGTFQPTGSTTIGCPVVSQSTNDIFIAKIDKNGNWKWAQSAGGNEFDQGRAIAIDRKANPNQVFVTGYTGIDATFGSGQG